MGRNTTREETDDLEDRNSCSRYRGGTPDSCPADHPPGPLGALMAWRIATYALLFLAIVLAGIIIGEVVGVTLGMAMAR